MTKDEKHKLLECMLFEKFAKRIGWYCSRELVSFGDPKKDEPDLVFNDMNETVAFEITTVAENEINQAYNDPHQDMIYSTPVAKNVITKKFNTQYKSKHPIELLICHNGAMDHDEAILEDLNSVISVTKKHRLQTNLVPWGNADFRVCTSWTTA